MAFQLVDDVLDYVGNAAELGKNVGDDLAEGKPTLPLIYTMQNGTAEQVQMIRQAIRKGGTENLAEIIEIVQSCGAIDYTNQKAREHVNAAQAAINVLPECPAKQALHALAEMALSRSS